MRRAVGRTLLSTLAYARSMSLLLVVAIVSLALAGCQKAAMLPPAPNLLVMEHTREYLEVPEGLRSPDIPVLYATDRIPTIENENIKYGYGRSKSLTFGMTTVGVGQGLTWDELCQQSCSSKRTKHLTLATTSITPMGTFGDTPVPLIVAADGTTSEDKTVTEANRLAESQLHDLLRSRLALTPRKEVFIFVHGYNNSFDEAIFRIGEIWHYLGRVGVPIAYTWPAGSKGLLRGYTHDRESGEFTIFHLKQFIRSVAACPEVERITFIGHSRGCDVLMSALRELNMEYCNTPEGTRRMLKVGQVVLAAPDLDLEVTSQRIAAERLGPAVGHLTVYVCPDDNAIGIAGWLFSSTQRLGRLRLDNLTEAQRESAARMHVVDFIDVHVKLDLQAHGYFTSNPAVLSDLILVLRDNREPGEANGRPLVYRGGAFWELQSGYPQVASLQGQIQTFQGAREP